MKGLTGSAGAVAVIALGLYPGAASANSWRHELASHGPTGGAEVAGIPSTNVVDGSGPSHLDTRRRRLQAANDDAFDVNGTVSDVCCFACKYFLVADKYLVRWGYGGF